MHIVSTAFCEHMLVSIHANDQFLWHVPASFPAKAAKALIMVVVRVALSEYQLVRPRWLPLRTGW